jgi:ketosteroid isomerase-like protein
VDVFIAVHIEVVRGTTMKVLLTASFLVLVSTVVAQTSETVRPLKSLVETEQAFSQAAADKSTREAFLLFIADDGILFRPKAVNGKQWLIEHPTPASEKRPLLAWQPVFADVALAGDLGYTTGPWEYKEDIKDEKPVAYGDFVTVWKKQRDGSWKFAVDLGISHPESSGPLNLWKVPDAPSSKSTNSRSTRLTKHLQERERMTLVKRDLEFADSALTLGFVKAFLKYAGTDVRLFREKSAPFVGRQSSAAALDARKEKLTWQTTGEDVSLSGDLGYTRGLYEARSDDSEKKLIERGNYLRIWKKQNGVWRVVLAVANPLPAE